jgi:glucose-6-phosphate isomerase
MLRLDITGTLAKAITPSYGIPEQEITALRTSLRKYIEDWLRERENGEHDWAMDPYRKASVERVEQVAARLKKSGVETVVWIGIGGSGLGPKVLQEVFETPQTVEFIVLDTIDPAALQTLVAILDWKKTALIAVSKSGETLETMSAFFFLWEEMKRVMKDRAAERVVGITDPKKGALRTFCIDEGIELLTIPPAVGGRFCIFSPVGLLPLAMLQTDIRAFIRGAKEMDTCCQSTSLEENTAALLAAVQFLLDTRKGYPIRVIMPYAERLVSFARWNQQLIAESLGKKEVKNPVPLAAIGTQDQHSLLQQWLAGPRLQWHLFIREEDKPRVYVPTALPGAFSFIAGKTFGQLVDACEEGTARALTSAKRPRATLTLSRLDPYHLGQLFFLFLAEVVLLGKLYRIDPYGQPAVEIGKAVTRDILTHGRAH